MKHEKSIYKDIEILRQNTKNKHCQIILRIK